MKEVEKFGPGHVIGESALFLDTPQEATIEAVEDSEIAVLDRDIVSLTFVAKPECECVPSCAS